MADALRPIKQCPTCGNVAYLDAKHCSECGHKFETDFYLADGATGKTQMLGAMKVPDTTIQLSATPQKTRKMKPYVAPQLTMVTPAYLPDDPRWMKSGFRASQWIAGCAALVIIVGGAYLFGASGRLHQVEDAKPETVSNLPIVQIPATTPSTPQSGGKPPTIDAGSNYVDRSGSNFASYQPPSSYDPNLGSSGYTYEPQSGYVPGNRRSSSTRVEGRSKVPRGSGIVSVAGPTEATFKAILPGMTTGDVERAVGYGQISGNSKSETWSYHPDFGFVRVNFADGLVTSVDIQEKSADSGDQG